jgi:hypothetical protein
LTTEEKIKIHEESRRADIALNRVLAVALLIISLTGFAIIFGGIYLCKYVL